MKKNFENYFLYGFLILAVGAMVLAFTGFTFDTTNNIGKTDTKKNTEAIEESGFKLISSGSTDPGEVSVDLKPHEAKDGKLEVDISVNTHSVDLDQFDLKEITTLEFDGKSINPTSAMVLSGHHNSGTLVFDVGKDIDSFTIKIIGIPKVEERVFEWR
ncbi:MAG: hypothetical protein ISS25_00125 [Nanoarchaeota archaeon]|nr:hypothetical protein [DPANN group archaeon]MBL7116225.1 hypothetical protein [Nanoarchaeota archaeon]